MKDEPVTHLIENETYDESRSWCEPEPTERQQLTRHIGRASCIECLAAASRYGNAAMMRIARLMSEEDMASECEFVW